MEKITYSPKNPEKSKQEIWDLEKNKVDKIVDRLGLGIDEEIKDVVIGLRAFGINTIGSHAGEIGRCSAPYITIASPQGLELQQELEEKEYEILPREQKDLYIELAKLLGEGNVSEIAGERIDAIEQEIDEYHRTHMDDFVQFDYLREEIRKEHGKEHDKAILLLNEFYESHEALNPGAQLVFDGYGYGVGEVVNRDFDKQKEEKDENEEKLRLRDFQQEMNAFAEFLKNKFLKG